MVNQAFASRTAPSQGGRFCQSEIGEPRHLSSYLTTHPMWIRITQTTAHDITFPSCGAMQVGIENSSRALRCARSSSFVGFSAH